MLLAALIAAAPPELSPEVNRLIAALATVGSGFKPVSIPSLMFLDIFFASEVACLFPDLKALTKLLIADFTALCNALSPLSTIFTELTIDDREDCADLALEDIDFIELFTVLRAAANTKAPAELTVIAAPNATRPADDTIKIAENVVVVAVRANIIALKAVALANIVAKPAAAAVPPEATKGNPAPSIVTAAPAINNPAPNAVAPAARRVTPAAATVAPAPTVNNPAPNTILAAPAVAAPAANTIMAAPN